MKKNNLRKVLAIALVLTTLGSTGCAQKFTSESVQAYPLGSFLSQQEVIDYYAKSLEYDAVVSKNVTVHRTDYELKDIDAGKADELKLLVSEIEEVLSKNEHKIGLNETSVISEELYNYIKASIDGYSLSNGNVIDIKGALGYYFVDVKYDITAQGTGAFKENVDMLGLDGVWVTKSNGDYEVDEAYLTTAMVRLNEYFLDNEIDIEAVIDLEKGTISFVRLAEGTNKDKKEEKEEEGYYAGQEGAGQMDTPTGVIDRPTTGDTDEQNTANKPNDSTAQAGNENAAQAGNENANAEQNNTPVNGDATATNPATPANPVNPNEGNTGATTNPDVDTDNGEDNTPNEDTDVPEINDGTESKGDIVLSNSVVAPERKVQLDIEFINNIIGTSLNQSSFLPELELVYDKPNSGMGGFCIYPEGINGLRIFGYNREELAGTLTMRYVFKDSIDGIHSIECTNIYVHEQEITTGFNVASQNVIIPEFLTSQLEQLIERADRLQVNSDIPGMMNGDVYEDKGYAVLMAYKDSCANTVKYMSTIRQVIARDTANNAYLLEVETTLMDGAKSVDIYGTFTDRSYVVVQQLGDKFVISDSVKISRTTEIEPDINPDSTITKRLIALNLSGSISDENKTAIKTLMSDLYTAGTNRILNGPKEITVSGQTVTIEKGMYDCFNSDVTMVSSEDNEYMNSTLRNKLTKMGTNVSAVYSGTVTEWIGGYKNQAEFTTEELITYAGMNEGHYMQVYYLVSKMNDVWVIDERTIIDEYKVTGTDLDNIKARVGQ